jgi:hypothetical protein
MQEGQPRGGSDEPAPGYSKERELSVLIPAPLRYSEGFPFPVVYLDRYR